MHDTQPETFLRRCGARLKEAAPSVFGAGMGVLVCELVESHSLLDAAASGGMTALISVPILLVIYGLQDAFDRQRRA